MNIHSRQSFLGDASKQILNSVRIGIVGLGGGGSHIAQQLAHIGVGTFIIVDPQTIDPEGTNLNRLVGATVEDVKNKTPKVAIASRLILGINPSAEILPRQSLWSEALNELRMCTVIFGCVDSFRARDELESFCRRNLIAYIDIGMDVGTSVVGHFICGQAILSSPNTPCLRCVGMISNDKLTQEAKMYGDVGPRAQVIWPNALLASTTVALFMQLIVPWHNQPVESAYLELDGNSNTISPSYLLKIRETLPCTHYPIENVGDPFFTLTNGNLFPSGDAV
jgi:molybdopterin-synthase adenylyltransferase